MAYPLMLGLATQLRTSSKVRALISGVGTQMSLISKIIICGCYLLSLIGAQPLLAQTIAPIPGMNSPAKNANLRVGVIMEMPFAQNIDGHYSGIAVDIWNKVAKLNNWHYTLVPLTNNVSLELLKLTGKGDLDIIIGPISVTSERLQQLDFTRPFFLSSIGVIAPKHELNIIDVMDIFLSRNLLLAILILFLSFIIYIHLLWYLEWGKIDGVSRNYLQAMRKEIWLHLCKKGLAMPSTFYGRLISLIWIVFAAALITSITANYTAAMTVSLSQSNSKIKKLQTLQRAKVAGVVGEVNTQVAEKNGVLVRKVTNFNQAMQLLLTSQVEAVICDAPVGIEYLHRHGINDFVLSSFSFENDELAFAVRLNSPLRHRVDLAITSLQDDDSIIQLCRRYVGEDATRCDI